VENNPSNINIRQRKDKTITEREIHQNNMDEQDKRIEKILDKSC
jgi:hypothetical protein